MNYKNPVLRGMYPDPSVCRAGDKYYMVCSTFHYFPAVPLFESDDMVNWQPIGHCLSRKSQIDLSGTNTSGGIFAPTIRYNNGRFYMVTTNASTECNFYVYTDDIYGEWSEPIIVEQDGIDPSLFFEDGKSYFISNGYDEAGEKSCIRMCEIDIATGKKLSETKPLWYGTGGRFIEAPHLYKFGEYYYVLDAEGGTEYGHMVNYARSKNMWGPFEKFPNNPALTNRNLGGYIIQGAGHGDIIEDKNGNWWFMHLAFRQSGQWMTYHHLGRECCLVPVTWENDWFYIGDGTVKTEYTLPEIDFTPQNLSYKKTFNELNENSEWCFIRNYLEDKYLFGEDYLELTGTEDTLFSGETPTFAAFRQDEFKMNISVTVNGNCEEAGITFFMDESHHYELFLDNMGNAVLRLTIGCVSSKVNVISVQGNEIELKILADECGYHFSIIDGNNKIGVGYADTQHLSSEVAGGFTGVMIGLYAVDNSGNKAKFTKLNIEHIEH